FPPAGGDRRNQWQAPNAGPMRAPGAHHGGVGWEEVHGSLHLNFDTHPGMDAALEQMLPLGQTGDIEMPALNGCSLKHVDPPASPHSIPVRGTIRPRRRDLPAEPLPSG